MNTTWQEQLSYDIRLVWDNDHDTYDTIQVLIDESDSKWTLSLALADFYEESIDFILRETPAQSIGNALVSQICYNPGMSVFEDIADLYWRERRAEAC